MVSWDEEANKMAELRLYTEADGGEYVIIVTAEAKEEVAELVEDDHLEASVELDGDFSSWPTDRLLRQER